jgi:uncharacterized peroxidase-related enzyme
MSLAQCSPDQVKVLEESHASAKQNEYYLTLVHDAPVLRARSQLFNAIMYGRGGLPRAERELVATAESRVNGCVYCASVHSRLFVQLSKDLDTMQRLLDEGVETGLTPRYRSIVDFAVKLSATPLTVERTDLEKLRSAGLNDVEILDLINAVSMFAWANRLMLTLGEPEPAVVS